MRELFAQVSVFRGGFSLDAAERVCEADVDVVSGLAALAEQSLVLARVDTEFGARFAMLGVIRHFAAERLAESPRRDLVAERHAQSFLALAGRAPGDLVRRVRRRGRRLR